MIILELSLFFLSIIIVSVAIAGFGSLLSGKIVNNFFLDICFGLIVISILTTTFHFFYEIESFLKILILLIGLTIFFKKKNIVDYKLLIKKNIFFYIIIIGLLIPMFVSQKYHEDFGYYHLPYALTFLEEKIVFGLANINKAFVYNSIWLNLYPIFFLENQNYNYLTFPSFLLFLSFIIFSIDKILKKEYSKISNYYLSIVLFYFLLKFTRISEFGVDFPATIFAILGIFYFIKFYETNEIIQKKSFFYFNLSFSLFSILIKLSVLPIIILPIYLYFSNFKKLKFHIFNLKFLCIYFLGFVFLIQQFFYTGCLFFPTNLTCFSVSWFNPDHLKFSKELELINKSYSSAREIYSPEEYLENFTWFLFWLKRNFTEISEHLITIILPSLIFFTFLKKKKKKNYKIEKENFIYFFCLISLLFWLNFSPVMRFSIPFFVTIIFMISYKFCIKKKFSKNIFIFFVSIFLIFNFSKNIKRINDTKKVFVGIQKIENQYLLNEVNSNEYANIYYPDIKKNKKNGWQGRLCWDIPFICSDNKLDVGKKNGYLIVNKLKIKND